MESVMKGGWLMVDEWMWDGVVVGIIQLARRNFCSIPLKEAVTREKRETEKERQRAMQSEGGERKGGGSHIAHLQAVNNLEEHWGDETKMNTKHWQHLT